MFPVIHIFKLNIYPYGLMIGIGVIFAVLLLSKRCKNIGYDEDFAYNLTIITLVSGIIGAKLFFIIVEFPEIIKEPMLIIKDFSEGFVFYGGIIFGALAGYIYTRRKKISFLKTFDLAAPSIALAQSFGRIGCFFAGCCYGKDTESIFSIEFKNSPFAPNGIRLIPTQLISSAGNLIIFCILLWYDNKKKRKDGQTSSLYMILYSIGRFIIEFLRDDDRGIVFGIFTTSQFICIIVLIIGISIYRKVSSKIFKEEMDAYYENKNCEDVNENIEHDNSNNIDNEDKTNEKDGN